MKKNFLIQNEIKPGSSSLKDIFRRRAKFLPLNDTSALVDYYRLKKLKRLFVDYKC